jgi:lysophospholipase L1-like esterase
MRISRLAIAALALPLLAGCSSLVDNQTMGPHGTPSGGAMFANYVALGTSISAGVQSGGIDDSTQKQAFPYLLDTQMGLTPGVNWFYPSFPFPGCTPPYSNPLTSTYVGGTASTCTLINPSYVRPYQNNLGVPSIRLAQVLNIDDLSYPPTDTLKAALFVTGGRNPIDLVKTAQPTFVTFELGANDVLGAATHGSAALLTPVATFEAQWSAIADTVQATGAKVAVANVPNVTVIPHFSAGVIFWCLHNGGAYCPAAAGLPAATLPYSSPLFTVDSSCIASALYPAKGVGDLTLVTFKATATITGALAQSGPATLNCAAGTATAAGVSTAASGGFVLTPATVAAIATEVVQIDSFIHLQAIARNWAYVDFNGLLAANSALIPKFPNFSTPATLFGVLFSLDGIHPTAAGHKAIADAFVAAINAKYGSTLTAP